MRSAVIAGAALCWGWMPLVPLASASSPPSQGLSSPPSIDDVVEVPLVELRVAVEDSGGRPVEALGQDDFRLLLDGEPVQVSLFQPPGAGGAPDLRVVIFVDPTFLEPTDLSAALAAARDWLLNDLDASVPVTLVTAEPGLRLRQPPTRERRALAQTLAGLATLAGHSRAADESRQIRRDIERLLAEGRDSNRRILDQTVLALRSRISAFGAETRREVELALGRLQRVLVGMAGLPGRKVLVQVGGRFPIRAEQALGELFDAAFGPGSAWEAQRSDGGALSLEAAFGAPEPQRSGSLLKSVWQSANRHGVSLYILDASGPRSGEGLAGALGRGVLTRGGGSASLSAGRARGVGYGASSLLEELAEATGGQALVRGRRFAEGMRGWSEDLERQYVLGIVPPAGKGPGLYEVEIRLARGRPPGEGRGRRLTLRHRKSLRIRSVDEAATDGTLSTLLLGAADNSLEVAAQIETPGRSGEGTRLAIRLPLANLALVPEGRFHIGRISIFTAVGGLADRRPAVSKAVVPVRIANEDLLTSLGRQVEYRLELPVLRESDGVAVGVRDDFVPITSTLLLEAARPPL